MKGLSAIWFALIVLAMLAALTLWIDRAVQPPAPKRDGSTRHDPDYIVENFRINKTDPEGNPRYSLAGIDMRHYPDDDSTTVQKPFFVQYSAIKPGIQAQSERGLISSNGENVYMMDNVKIVRAATAQKGELTILTDYMHVIPDDGIMKTDHPVVILQAPDTVVHASGMVLNKKERTLQLSGRVKAHYVRPGTNGTAPPPPKAGKQSKSKAVAPKPNNTGSTKGKAKAGKQGTTTKPETQPGQSKTRVRRHYATTAP